MCICLAAAEPGSPESGGGQEDRHGGHGGRQQQQQQQPQPAQHCPHQWGAQLFGTFISLSELCPAIRYYY